jgi:hypothetical protein
MHHLSIATNWTNIINQTEGRACCNVLQLQSPRESDLSLSLPSDFLLRVGKIATPLSIFGQLDTEVEDRGCRAGWW